VADLSPQHLARVGNRLEVFVYLNRTSSLLEQNISADTFQLGCTPMVNLFPQRAEPIPLTHQDYEYRVVPDARRPMALEVYSIDSVTASSPSGQEVEYVPFFSTRHAVREPNEATYWWSTRRPAERPDEQVDRGTEVFLSLVDLGFRSSGAADWTVNVSTTCLNRDLPHRLPFGGNQPRLFRSAGGAPASRVVCLTPPTPTLRPGTRQGSRWRLISHLLLSHRSLDAPDGADALREILKLYDFQDSPETRSLIDGIAGVRCQGVVRRIPGSHGSGVGRGVEVEVLLDEDRFSGGGLFLFASVLERFLAMYCSINSFSQLVAVTRQREGVLRRWAPRTGVRSLL
jgi:type VI secretion system protein ImpG